MKITIPENFEIDRELSTENEIVLKEKSKIDFSILNDVDWFYIKTKGDFEYLHQGGFLFDYNNNKPYNRKTYHLNKLEINPVTKFIICKKEHVVELRLATKEEIENLNLYKKWEDFGIIEGFYINNMSNIINSSPQRTNKNNKNTIPSLEEAKAILALIQLMQWRDKYNEGWKPDWEDSELKHCITCRNNKIINNISFHNSYVLSFKTDEIRNKFYEDFKELLDEAKILL